MTNITNIIQAHHLPELIIFGLQIIFAFLCLFLLYKYQQKITSYEFHALAHKIALNDKNAHFNFSLRYFKDFHLYFQAALSFLAGILCLEFAWTDGVYLNHFLNFILIFTAFLYIKEKEKIHELSRQSMLKIILAAFAFLNIVLAFWKFNILPKNVHTEHALLYIHLITVAASFSFVLAILMHSAVMLSLKKALKGLQNLKSLKNLKKNEGSIFFKRDDFPSIEAMEAIFIKRLNYLFWALTFVLITGVVLILDLHANANISASTNASANANINTLKNSTDLYQSVYQSHRNYLPFYFKLIFSFILWAGIVLLKLYQRRHGLAISKIWYISLILSFLWLMSYGLSHYWG